jgi:hypothetical protein
MAKSLHTMANSLHRITSSVSSGTAARKHPPIQLGKDVLAIEYCPSISKHELRDEKERKSE